MTMKFEICADGVSCISVNPLGKNIPPFRGIEGTVPWYISGINRDKWKRFETERVKYELDLSGFDSPEKLIGAAVFPGTVHSGVIVNGRVKITI